MKNTRHLSLRRESLTELSNDEMSLAGGAIGGPPSLKVPTACDTQDYNWWLRDVMLAYTLHQHCSWSCI